MEHGINIPVGLLSTWDKHTKKVLMVLHMTLKCNILLVFMTAHDSPYFPDDLPSPAGP